MDARVEKTAILTAVRAVLDTPPSAARITPEISLREPGVLLEDIRFVNLDTV